MDVLKRNAVFIKFGKYRIISSFVFIICLYINNLSHVNYVVFPVVCQMFFINNKKTKAVYKQNHIIDLYIYIYESYICIYRERCIFYSVVKHTLWLWCSLDYGDAWKITHQYC